MGIDLSNAQDAIQIAPGRFFQPLHPLWSQIHLQDIAHALSNLCRFGGHCSKFYSVAQHSVLVSHYCPPEDALWGLMHDAAEAYLGDVPGPIKRDSRFGEQYRMAEVELLEAIAKRFGLPFGSWTLPETVHAADSWLLAAEARDLMGDPEWALNIRSAVSLPLGSVPKIKPLRPTQARKEFLLRYHQLRKPQ